jgi:signal transduction histidine kinase
MSNDARETLIPTSKRAEVSKSCQLPNGGVTIATLHRSSGNRRKTHKVFEASEATVFEVRPGGVVAFLHAGCASAARALGVSGQSIHADVTWEVANDNAVSPPLRRLLDRATGAAGAQRETVTLGGLDHDVCVVPQGRGRALCVLRPSRFAPGVAHDINGCLAAVVAIAEALLGDPGLSAEGHAAAADVLEGARRAGVLATQLMSASELGGAGHIDLGSELVHLVPLLRRLLPPGVRLAWEIGGDAPCVRVDPVHLQRIVMNLVTNAAQAGAGTVTVRATGEGSAASGGEVDTAVIEVSDDGRGMSEEALAAMERGGYSSRASGHGIGMANVRDLARLAGGAVEVSSAPAKGTRVAVTLPGFLPRVSGVLGFKAFVAKSNDGVAVTQ